MATVPDLTLWGVGRAAPPRALGDARTEPAYKIKPIGPRTGETKTAEYTALNPRQKIPLLQDGDFCIGESAAIVAYLSRTYSSRERALIPEKQRDYAAWLEWCFFIVTELDSTSLYVMRRHSADALGPIYGIAPEVVAKAGEYFREQLRHVEAALTDGRKYLMGDHFTSADILLTTCLDGRSFTASASATMPVPISSASISDRPISSVRRPTNPWPDHAHSEAVAWLNSLPAPICQ